MCMHSILGHARAQGEEVDEAEALRALPGHRLPEISLYCVYIYIYHYDIMLIISMIIIIISCFSSSSST